MEKTYNGITIEGPFSFDHTFKRHHRTTETLKSMTVNSNENRFVKWIYIGEKPYLLDAKIIEKDGCVTISTASDGVDLDQATQQYLSRMFGIDNSLNDFYDSFMGNERIEMLLNRFYGMRVITNPDLFETIVDTIIGQQINLKFAATLKERLVRFAGSVKEYGEDNLYLFPRPKDIAELEYEQLRELSFSQRKAEYIIDVARGVTNGEIQLDRLWSMANEEIIDELLPIRGIGRWTIECLMLFGLNRSNVLPAADIGLRNAIRAIYELDLQPRTEEVRMLAEEESWHPWESYITFYMWQYLNTLPK